MLYRKTSGVVFTDEFYSEKRVNKSGIKIGMHSFLLLENTGFKSLKNTKRYSFGVFVFRFIYKIPLAQVLKIFAPEVSDIEVILR